MKITEVKKVLEEIKKNLNFEEDEADFEVCSESCFPIKMEVKNKINGIIYAVYVNRETIEKICYDKLQHSEPKRKRGRPRKERK